MDGNGFNSFIADFNISVENKEDLLPKEKSV